MAQTKYEFKLGFATPAFLGNADQRAQWRTPPIKALLRQWWRVLAWNDGIRNLDDLRHEEGRWFGVAADDGGESRQSQVRIRLAGAWESGALQLIPGIGHVRHPEVDKGGPPCPKGAPGRMIEAGLYLGYGPISVKGQRSAIDPEKQKATLRISAPDDFPLDELIQLVGRFGTLGSRSRNGWGSLIVDGAAAPSADLLRRISRPLDDCLREEWPHALGRDDQGLLLWQTRPQGNWRDAMRELARIKIAFRTQRRLSLEGVRDGQFADRHVLAYPVTHHGVLGPYEKQSKSFGWVDALNPNTPKKDKAGYLIQGARLANQLRFKVVKENNSYLGLAFHLPCRLPDELAKRLAPGDRERLQHQELAVWRAVHDVLGNEMTRLGGPR